MKRSVLITGISGFIGRALAVRLAREEGLSLAGLSRHPDKSLPDSIRQARCDIAGEADFSSVLRGVDVVVHCAARVHVMRDVAKYPLAEFRKANVETTLRLARSAASAGVKRFIFLSTIKVNGETTPEGMPFRAGDPPAPQDAYGISKMEAESGLRKIAMETGLEVVVIRPPLVYGPGAKGNLVSMFGWIKSGVPLPFGSVRNLRSFVSLENLVDLVRVCITHPDAANRTFLVSDDHDLSTGELLRFAANAMGKRLRLLPVPVFLLAAAAGMLGFRSLSQRLLGSLQVDISETKAVLGWAPPVSVREGFESMMAGR